MQQLQSKLLAYSNQSMNDPQAGFAPIKTAAIDSVNRNYMDMPSRLSSQFASRGYGSSGNFGNSLYRTELSREGDMSSIESQFAKAAIDQRNQGASLGERLLASGRGTTSTSTGPDTSAANGFMSGGNALENISTLMMLSKALKGGGGGYPTAGTDYNPNLLGPNYSYPQPTNAASYTKN